MVGAPLIVANLVAFLASGFWGWLADVIGRRWSMMIPAFIGIFVTPVYLLTTNPLWIILGFMLSIILGFITQGFFAGAIYGQNPSYLAERFPTEVRSTASGFCYHQGAIFGAFVAPVLTYFAISAGTGFAIPMLVGTMGGLVSFILSVSIGPETRDKELVADLEIFATAEIP
jgi:SHS family lactate transporter-like MFS transporter